MTMKETYSALGPAVMALALLAVAACGGHDQRAETALTPSDAEATITAATAPVARLEVTRQVELFGTVRAERTAAVSGRVMAMVTRLAVHAGDRVTAGDLLVEIDPQTARGQLAQATGALGQTRAALSLAERNHQRFEALAAREAASELELDMARMQYEQALGAVEQAEGAVAAAAAIAEDSRVLAPFSGRVVRTLVERGDLAAPGRPLVVLESTDANRLAVQVPEGLLLAARLEVGQPLGIRVDSRPELDDLQGTIVEVSPGADPLTHSFDVEVAIPASSLASGLAGRASIPAGTQSVIAVPVDAILRRGGLAMVVLRTPDGRSESRIVTLGDELAAPHRGLVEVLSGLAGGEEVVLGLAAAPPTGTRVETGP